jgi:hypothetical protein
MVDRYDTSREPSDLAQLDWVYQEAEFLIEEKYMVANIEARYGPAGKSSVGEAKKRCLDAGFVHGLADYEVTEKVKTFISQVGYSAFRGFAESTIRNLPEKERTVARVVALHYVNGVMAGAYDYRDLAHYLSLGSGLSESMVKQIAILVGCNNFYFSTKRFSGESFLVPPFFGGALTEFWYLPGRFGDKLTESQKVGTDVLGEPAGRNVAGFLASKRFGSIPDSELQEFRASTDKESGTGNFDLIVSKLLFNELITIGSFDSHRWEHRFTSTPILDKLLKSG